MSHSVNIKNPPLLNNFSTYEDWEKSIQLWQLVTDLPSAKQGSAIVLSLSGKARETVLQLPVTEISSETGVQNILDKLGALYKKDAVCCGSKTVLFQKSLLRHNEIHSLGNIRKF